MRKTVITLLYLLFCSLLQAQNATLTKDETVGYLKKKLSEIDKQSAGTSSTFSFSGDVSLYNTTLSLKFCFSSATSFTCYKYSFNPAYIKEITQEANSGTSATGWVKVRVANKSAVEEKIYTNPDTKSSVDLVWIPYLVADGSNFEKIKKALLHMQALLKAEDDPFGN